MSPGNDRPALAVLLVALALGTVGFFAGVTQPAEPRGYGAEAEPAAGPAARLAPTQAELALGLGGPNRDRFRATFERLAERRPLATDPVAPASPAAWDEAVAARSLRRAYDGAPPVVPHAVDQASAPACLACHERGLVVAGLLAPPMSHAPFSSCTQCHSAARAAAPSLAEAESVSVESRWAGLARSGRGERAWQGAPPTVPHRSRMRERCESCHGVLAGALRCSHAARQSCRQCHALPADTAPDGAGPPGLALAPAFATVSGVEP